LSRARRIAKAVLPPVLAESLRAVRRWVGSPRPPTWEFVGDRWPEGRGWNDPSVARTMLAEWSAFVEGLDGPRPVARATAPDGRATLLDVSRHNTLMTFAYVVGLASARRERIAVLDWGCGLGQYGALAQALYPAAVIDYHCRELPILAQVGRTVLPGGTFLEDDESTFARRYDLVVASGSLHYVRDWRALLIELAGATDEFLYVTRLPVVERAASYVVVQRPRERYDTEYPGWVLNRADFLACAATARLELEREFLVGEQATIPGVPELPDYRGFLFRVTSR
jgi:putative methyltransferase (TIGR04325 family)